MTKHSYHSRAQYVLAHNVVSSYFHALPRLPFLQDRQNERQCFAKYLKWGPYDCSWTYWQKALLYNIYERRREKELSQRDTFSITKHSLRWAKLLQLYLYSPYNPMPLEFFQQVSIFSRADRQYYEALAQNGCLPTFQHVLQECAPETIAMHAIVKNAQVTPLTFSKRAQVSSMIVRAPSITVESKMRKLLKAHETI